MSIDPERFTQFAAIPFIDQPFAEAKAPRTWADFIGITDSELEGSGFTLDDLPETVLTRAEVRAICTDRENPVMFGYICCMAWGNQGVPPRSNSARMAWAGRDKTAGILLNIRDGGLTRSEAYELFCGEGEVSGLGVSYFTKLIFFFMPNDDCYIMDQWTGKSINYLAARSVVRMTREAPTRANTGANYADYCRLVDLLGNMLAEIGQESRGEKVEQRLFSKGGKGNVVGAWRRIIRRVGSN